MDYTVHGIQARTLGNPSLLRGIFPTQGSNPGLLHCRWILYQLSYQGSLQGWRTIKERNIMIIEILPKEQGPEPHIGHPNWESCIQGNDPLQHLAFKTSRVHFWESWRAIGNRDSALKGYVQNLICCESQHSGSSLKEVWVKPTCDLRETPRDAGSNWGTSRDGDIGIGYFGEPILPL